MKVKLMFDDVVEYEKEVTQTPPVTPPEPPPVVPPVVPPSTGPGDGTALHPFRLNNLKDGAYIKEGADTPVTGLSGGKDVYYEVIPGVQGHFQSVMMSVKGFGGSDGLMFFWAAWKRDMSVVLKEYTRVFISRSLAFEANRNNLPWDLDEVRYVFRIQNGGNTSAQMEVSWTGNL